MADENIKNPNKNTLGGLFLSMLRIGIMGFGGGAALIPVIYSECVEDKHYVSEEEFDEVVTIANLTPGALPVEIAGGIGHILFGAKGTIAGAFGMALPGVSLLIILLVLLSFLSEGALLKIKYISVGITAYICILLVDYIKGCFEKKGTVDEFQGKKISAKIVNIHALIAILLVFILTGEKNIYSLLGLSRTPIFGLSTFEVFILVFFILHINAGEIKASQMIISLVTGIIYVLFKSRSFPWSSNYLIYGIYALMLVLSIAKLYFYMKEGRRISSIREHNLWRRDILMLLAITGIMLVISLLINKKALTFALNGFLSSVMSFGGGDAYLTVADGLFVANGIVDEGVFYESLVPIANVCPGSILCKVLSGIGFFMGSGFSSIFMALLGLSVSVMASMAAYGGLCAVYEYAGELPTFTVIKKWIRPIVSGLMITVMGSLLCSVKKIGGAEKGYLTILVGIISYAAGRLMLKMKCKRAIVTLVMALIAVAGCLILM